MSMSESKFNFDEWGESEAYKLPDFPGGDVPKKIIVSEQAKRVFELARENQGMIGLAWLGKDEEDQDVLYLDMLPAFNKNDQKLRSDKYGREYKVGVDCVYTDEPLGGNSGRNHLQFIEIIQNRIQTAYQNNDEKALKSYEGCYSINANGKITLLKSKMFGFGLFKGDENTNFLLSDFRSVSANINSVSIKRNSEYLLVNFFYPDKDINDPEQKEYYLKRPIPLPIALRIQKTLLENLPLDNPQIIRICFKTPRYNEEEQKEWVTLRNQPEEKIHRLYDTLCKFLDLKFLKPPDKSDVRFGNHQDILQAQTRAIIKKIKEIMVYIKKNIELIEPDLILRQARLKAILEKSSKHNGMNAFDIASFHHEPVVLHYLKTETQIEEDYIFDQALINKIATEENGDLRLLQVLLEHNRNVTVFHFENEESRLAELFQKLPENFKVVVEENKLCKEDNVIKLLIFLREENSDQINLLLRILQDLKHTNQDAQRIFDDIFQLLSPNINQSTSLEANWLLFFHAIQENKKDLVNKLIENFDLDSWPELLKIAAKDNHQTLLFVAAQNGHMGVIERLLDDLSLADRLQCLKQTTTDGMTPLFAAAECGHLDVIEYLLANLNAADRLAYLKQSNTDSMSPLFVAMINGHIDIVKILTSTALSYEMLAIEYISTPDQLREFARIYNVPDAMENYLGNHQSESGKVKITALDMARIIGSAEITDYLAHQINLAETYVYTYAREIDRYILKAEENKWDDLANALKQHKSMVIDPQSKLDESLASFMEISPFLHTKFSSQSILVNNSLFESESGNQEARSIFISNINHSVNKFISIIKAQETQPGSDEIKSSFNIKKPD